MHSQVNIFELFIHALQIMSHSKLIRGGLNTLSKRYSVLSSLKDPPGPTLNASINAIKVNAQQQMYKKHVHMDMYTCYTYIRYNGADIA